MEAKHLGFSGAVKLDDLNDALGLAQDCIVPIVQSKPSSSGQKNESWKLEGKEKPDLIKLRKVKISSKKNSTSQRATQDRNESKVQEETAAQVSLTDCLACSGCVTSSEAILVKEQSLDIFLDRATDSAFCAVSISPRSILFIAQHYAIPAPACFRKVAHILRRFCNARLVLTTEIGDVLHLLETARGFAKLYFSNDSGHGSDQSLSTASPHALETSRLPMLASHCPGWICYAEKSVSEAVVSKIQPLKSSQQIMGHLLKTLTVDAINFAIWMALRHRELHLWDLYSSWAFCKWFSCRKTHSDSRNRDSLHGLSEYQSKVPGNRPIFNQEGISKEKDIPTARRPSRRRSLNPLYVDRGDVFHATIMTCYDKKLETMRSDGVLKRSDNNSQFPVENVPAQPFSRSTQNSKNEDMTSVATDAHKSKGAAESAIREVDLVLATVDIIELIERRLGIKSLATYDEMALENQQKSTYSPASKSWSFNNGAKRASDDVAPPSSDDHFNSKPDFSSKADTSKRGIHVVPWRSDDLFFGLDRQYPLFFHSQKNGASPLSSLDSNILDVKTISHPSNVCACCNVVRLTDKHFNSLGLAEFVTSVIARLLPQQVVFKEEDDATGMRHLVLASEDGEKEFLRCVLAYGFRNVRNAVRLAKPRKGSVTEETALIEGRPKKGPSTVHFVEVMACPRGCLGGSGQVAPRIDGAAKTSAGADDKTTEIQCEIQRDELVIPPHMNTVSRVVDPFEYPGVRLIYDYFESMQCCTKPKEESSAGSNSVSSKRWIDSAVLLDSEYDVLDWAHSTFTSYKNSAPAESAGVALSTLRW